MRDLANDQGGEAWRKVSISKSPAGYRLQLAQRLHYSTPGSTLALDAPKFDIRHRKSNMQIFSRKDKVIQINSTYTLHLETLFSLGTP